MDSPLVLDLLSSRDKQLEVLVAYLEAGASNENKTPLLLTNQSTVLASRVLGGWKEYVIPKKSAVTEEGAYRYYLHLKESE